jgi:hypothetical protein
MLSKNSKTAVVRALSVKLGGSDIFYYDPPNGNLVDTTTKGQTKMRTIDMAATKKAITAHFAAKNNAAIAVGIKPRRALTEKLQAEMLQAVELIIVPQIAEHLNLDLSSKIFADTLGTPARRAKQLREELQAAGILICPRRSTQKGEYPLWLAVSAYIIYPTYEKKAWKPTTSKKYNALYCQIRDAARREVAANVATQEIGYTGVEYGKMINDELNSIIASLGLTKGDLVK